MREAAQFTFVLKKGASGWLIHGWTWTGPKPKAAAPAKKLSFKDKHALEKLPGEIDALQKDLAALQSKIADPDLYARDRKSFDDAMAKIATLTAAISQAEEKWLELETLRESLEA